jgi:hypothetical protein
MSRGEWLKPELKQNTQKLQNVAFTPRDVEKTPGEEQARPQLAEELELLSAEDEARSEDDNYAGRQMGTNRAEHEVYAVARAEKFPKVEPPEAAFEGSLRDRAPGGDKPGISNASSSPSSSRDQPGQRPVVSERPDAQAGVNKNAG